MKRQKQELGVRKWYGDDFINLQNQLYQAIENGFFKDLGNVIVSGCEITDNGDGTHTIANGYVYLDRNICPFTAVTKVTLPVYLVKQTTETEKRIHADGNSKATAVEHIAILGALSASAITIDGTNKQRLLLPKYDKNGNLAGLPISSIIENTDKKLLTAKALYDFKEILFATGDADSIVNTLQEVFNFVKGLPEGNKALMQLINSKANIGHSHSWNGITSKPISFPASTHNHDGRYYTETEMDAKLTNKVEKEAGKGLSENDYTDAEKQEVAKITNKVDKVTGKGLSTNDYTNLEKQEVANLPKKMVEVFGLSNGTLPQDLPAFGKKGDICTCLGYNKPDASKYWNHLIFIKGQESSNNGYGGWSLIVNK